MYIIVRGSKRKSKVVIVEKVKVEGDRDKVY